MISSVREAKLKSTERGMSPPVAQQILSSMKIIMGEDGTDMGAKRIFQLKHNALYFRRKLKEAGFIVYGSDDSPVVPVALYMPTKLAFTHREMKKRGVATVVVGFPATGLAEGRARFCISAAHTKEMLDHAIEAMCEVGAMISVRYPTLPDPVQEIQDEELSGEKNPTEFD
ncbi:Serine palmitoyltransferase 2 [Orchesella cincta]|uniref:Serine palmitoyltransferase 2 n=1 Tax=Orchesella cincta TaxID=48709 RepID=A0A1D2M2Q2_ORCCI|nr:Serine palmitoyltransferase 2 [Orchesella cincta]